MAVFSVDRSVCDSAGCVFIGLHFCGTQGIMLAVNYSNESSLLTTSFTQRHGFCISVTSLLPGWNCLTPTSPAAHWSSWSGTTPSHRSACGSLITSLARRRWRRGPTTPKLRQVRRPGTTHIKSLAIDDNQGPTVGWLWSRLMLPGNQWCQF